MIHPSTELRFISPEIGYGVIATACIPKGTITWIYDELDRCFTTAQIEAMDTVYKKILYKYSYRDHKGDHILCWDHSRFINHSFNANCITTAYNFEIAVKDIYPGEELTDDYGFLNAPEPFPCLPEPNTSRTHVMPDDLLHYYKEWDEKLIAAFHHFNRVEQPLSFLLNSAEREKMEAIASGVERMDSILNCYYNEDDNLMLVKEALLSSYA